MTSSIMLADLFLEMWGHSLQALFWCSFKLQNVRLLGNDLNSSWIYWLVVATYCFMISRLSSSYLEELGKNHGIKFSFLSWIHFTTVVPRDLSQRCNVFECPFFHYTVWVLWVASEESLVWIIQKNILVMETNRKLMLKDLVPWLLNPIICKYLVE